MNAVLSLFSPRRSCLKLFLLAACFFLLAPFCRAGLTINILMYHTVAGISSAAGYDCNATLMTNSTLPAAPLGYYIMSSPTNAWHTEYQLTGSSFALTENIGRYYPDFDSFIRQVTNGNWTITVTNSTSTNVYKFSIGAGSFTSNVFSAPVSMTFPTDGAVITNHQPTYTWQGPSPWSGSLNVENYNSDFSVFQSVGLSTSATSWPNPSVLSNGNYTFGIFYNSDQSSSIVASTPVNTNTSANISGWVSTASLQTYQFINYSVTNGSSGSGGGGSGGHTLMAYYSFDDGDINGNDFSGNGYDLGFPFEPNSGTVNITADAKFGPDAVAFQTNNAGFSYYYTSESNLLSTLQGSFSISLWLKTSQVSGNDTDDGITANVGIVSTFFQTVVPMALTGHKLAFVTDSSSLNTLHSSSSVSTGSYVHVVVTRDSTTGAKKIYVNGALDASGNGETGSLNDPLEMEIGSGNGHGFNGELDDIQIYTNVLSGSEVSQLFNNPGTTIPNGSGGGGDLGTALNATNLTWTTSGGSNWFVETTNTHDGVSAAQSGALTGNQFSSLQTTVTGPGTLTFWWSTVTAAGDFDFDLEFDIDGGSYFEDDIFNIQPWTQESTINIPAGSHTLTWTAFAGDSASDAGYVDQVTFTPSTATTVLQSAFFEPVIINDQSAITPGGGFWIEPYLFQVQPLPVTYDEIDSPSGKFTSTYTNDFSPNGLFHQLQGSWAAVANECTNGLWTLTVNKGDVSQKQFKFSVTLTGLNTNLLSPVTVLTPANGSVNVPTNSPVQWSPANSTVAGILVSIGYPTNNSFGTYMGNNGGLPGTVTNWSPSDADNYGPGGFSYGTNYALLEIFYSSLPAIAVSIPTNAAMDVISNWTYSGEVETRSSDSFLVGAPAPLPVQMTAPSHQSSPGNFQLGFQTVAGRPETLQIRTNLMAGTWVDLTNFIGDGSSHQYTFPTTNVPGAYFRILTQ